MSIKLNGLAITPWLIFPHYWSGVVTLTCASRNRTWTVPHAQTHNQGSQSHHLLFKNVSKLHYPGSLPLIEDTFPRKPEMLQLHKALPFQSFFTERLNNLIKSRMILYVEAVQLTTCPKTLFSTHLTFAEENSRCHKISLFKSHDHNSITILISTLISTPLCVIFLW